MREPFSLIILRPDGPEPARAAASHPDRAFGRAEEILAE